MKYVLIALLMITITLPVARAQEGTVFYEETLKMDIELPPELEAMGHEIPDVQVTDRVLYFNESASLYRMAEEQSEPAGHNFNSDDGIEIRIERSGNDNKTYLHFDEGKQIEKREFLGKDFLITGEEGLAWKLTDERSEFLGYMCLKATAQRDSTTYEAWFSPEISVPTGPGQGGLPGLILVMNINDGERSFVAKELKLEPVEDGLIAPPKKGKKVTRVEFETIVEERMKEMNATRGGRGIFIQMDHE